MSCTGWHSEDEAPRVEHFTARVRVGMSIDKKERTAWDETLAEASGSCVMDVVPGTR